MRWYPEGAAPPAPVPFDNFLFKVASRCNLACPYCYVYELRDQGWRSQPTSISDATFEAGLDRIREHVLSHGQREINVIFHGGEPLLLGPERLDILLSRVAERLAGVSTVHLGMQTNGTLLDERFIAVARRHKLRMGLSVDGPPAHHDKYRFDHQGRGTSAQVQRAADLLRANPDVYGGLLCVISLETPPEELFEYLCSQGAGSVDLILPHATHDDLPPGAATLSDVDRYGEWLLRFLELWYRSPDGTPDLRYFSSILRLLAGGYSLVESIGLSLSSLVVIESNGDIEAVDSLKACFEGAAVTGFNVLRDSFDAAITAPAFASRQMGVRALAEKCRSCSYLDVCGGGYQPHRFSKENGFVNPSIYCRSIQKIVGRLAELMSDDLERAAQPVPRLARKLSRAKTHA